MGDFGKNQSVADALDAYLELKRPKFAALIDSPWGSGKTWFIRKYFEEKKKEIDSRSMPEKKAEQDKCEPVFCYVSLFDIADAKDIDTSIIAQANPLFYSKNAKRWGRFSRFALERTVSYLPIENPDKVSEVISSTIQQLLNRRPENFVVCLDDIERTRLPIEMVFGYMSSLLEEADAKVILLCNSNEMEKGKKHYFDMFREKVIGISLSIYDDKESIFNEAIDTACDDIKHIINENKNIILNIYDISNTKNLRHIRRIVFEFSILYKNISDNLKKDKIFISDILKYLFVLSIEKHSNPNSFDEKFNWDSKQWFGSLSLNNIKAERTLSKYSIDTFCGLFCPKFWKDFIFYGIIDNEYIDSYYKISEYNKDKRDIPEPLKLFHFWRMNDEDFEYNYEKMIYNIEHGIYTDPGIILHAYSEQLLFSKIGLKNIDLQKIVEHVKQYIEYIDFKKLNRDSDLFMYNKYHYEGFKFYESETQEFKEIYEIVKYQYVKKIQEKYINKYKNIFELIPDRIDDFCECKLFNDIDSNFACSVFININYKELSERICILSNSNIKRVSDLIIKSIYNNITMFRMQYFSKDELTEWIENLCLSLKMYSKNIKPLARYGITLFINRLYEIKNSTY